MPKPRHFYPSSKYEWNPIASSIPTPSDSYDVLDVSDFHHSRINHSQLFADQKNHINGIENFWNQAKRHMRRFNVIKQENFYWFLKECEWRFNGGNHRELLKQLKYSYKQANR